MFSRLTGALATVVLVLAPALPANADSKNPATFDAARSPSDVPCEARFIADIDPGFSLNPSSGRYTTHGESGNIECTGSVHGHRITGPGTRGEDGHLGLSSCTNPAGDGAGTWAATVPTDAGPQHLSDDFTFQFGPAERGIIGGNIDGKRLYGNFQVIPLKGNCVTEPVTQVLVICHEWLVADTVNQK